MARTPDVVANEVIQAAWGNEVRDRSNQVFADTSELNTWTSAPNGALAVDLALPRLHVRLGGAWVPLSFGLGSNFQGTTNASSDLVVTHGLGIIPRSVIASPNHEVNANTAQLQIVGRTAQSFTVRCRNFDGLGQANTVVGVYWHVDI